MEELIQKFARVYIDHSARQSAVAERLIELFAPEQITMVSGLPAAKGALSADEFDASKRNLFVTEYKGQFFKRCPGAKPHLSCCNYFILNLGLQCDMNCSYCYLQSFINTPMMTIYSNIDQALGELRKMAIAHPQAPYRVGTGETIDSLSLDPLTLYSHRLIEFFREFPAWRLEFKTKSSAVDHFLRQEHAGNVIVSWSINPQPVISSEEHQTASLTDRLGAARRAHDAGFQIAFHIDPMIWHPGWRDHYHQLVDEIHARFTPEEVPYISLGALRFQPEQRHMMRERFGYQSWVNRAEMHLSADGKLRYDHELRNEMFQAVIQCFREHDRNWKIFLCMETPESWLDSFQSPASQVEGLQPLFKRLPEIKMGSKTPTEQMR
jgi:spore photoproduct lyase